MTVENRAIYQYGCLVLLIIACCQIFLTLQHQAQLVVTEPSSYEQLDADEGTTSGVTPFHFLPPATRIHKHPLQTDQTESHSATPERQHDFSQLPSLTNRPPPLLT